jgi:hypothetical protein
MEHHWRNADWNSIRFFWLSRGFSAFARRRTSLQCRSIPCAERYPASKTLLGYLLLFRESEGVRLTDEGRRVVLAARDVESSVSDMWRVAAMAERDANGPIRLAITEGLGSFWLTPRIVDT